MIYIIFCTKIADEWQIYCGVIPDITVLFSLIIAGAFSIIYKAFLSFFLKLLYVFYKRRYKVSARTRHDKKGFFLITRVSGLAYAHHN
jgi:hypothetical protein